MNTRQIANREALNRLCRMGSLLLAGSVLIASPQTAGAHGELLIRIATLTRQIQAATNNPAQLYLQRAEVHREHKDWDAAASDYDCAARLDHNLFAVDYCRAVMLADAGKFEAALTMFGKAIERSPAEGLAFIGRARVLAELGQRQAAIADFRKGISLLSEPDPNFFLELAQTQIAGTLTNEALQSLDDGIQKFGPVLLLQAYALDLELRRGNNESALARLDTILEHAPRKESWLARRGDILLAAGQPSEARTAYEDALKATETLPPPLQRGPPIQKLRSRINAALAKIINSPPIAKIDGNFFN
jgi:tetratricopeptide (TPR) repeat protein